MKKIPCLFQRDFSGLNKRAGTPLLRDVTPGCECVLAGEGTASRKHDGTYELIGPKIGGNPEGVSEHVLLPHGCVPLDPPRDFDGLQAYLKEHMMEGIVFKHDDGRMCKIRRRDFGLAWPVKGGV